MVRPLLTFFWLFGLPILWLLSIWWLLRSPRSGAPGDSLHMLTAVFTVGAVLIAFASYQYANAGQRQLAAVGEHAKTLDSQRQALEASRRSLEQTLEASEKSRETHARMLENAKESPREGDAVTIPAVRPTTFRRLVSAVVASCIRSVQAFPTMCSRLS